MVANLFQWQTLITHRGPYDACQGVQLVITALLGHVYGALSKVRDLGVNTGSPLTFVYYRRTAQSAPPARSFVAWVSSGPAIAACSIRNPGQSIICLP